MDGGTRGSRRHDNKGHNPYRRLSTSDSHEHQNLHLDYEPFRLPLCHCLLLYLSHSHGSRLLGNDCIPNRIGATTPPVGAARLPMDI